MVLTEYRPFFSFCASFPPFVSWKINLGCFSEASGCCWLHAWLTEQLERPLWSRFQSAQAKQIPVRSEIIRLCWRTTLALSVGYHRKYISDLWRNAARFLTPVSAATCWLCNQIMWLCISLVACFIIEGYDGCLSQGGRWVCSCNRMLHIVFVKLWNILSNSFFLMLLKWLLMVHILLNWCLRDLRTFLKFFLDTL